MIHHTAMNIFFSERYIYADRIKCLSVEKKAGCSISKKMYFVFSHKGEWGKNGYVCHVYHQVRYKLCIWNNANCCSFCVLNIHGYTYKMYRWFTQPPIINTHLIWNHKFSFRIDNNIPFCNPDSKKKSDITYFWLVYCVCCVGAHYTVVDIDLPYVHIALIHVFTKRYTKMENIV